MLASTSAVSFIYTVSSVSIYTNSGRHPRCIKDYLDSRKVFEDSLGQPVSGPLPRKRKFAPEVETVVTLAPFRALPASPDCFMLQDMLDILS